ncbi:cell division protein PerM [Promicromonospora sukumoe]
MSAPPRPSTATRSSGSRTTRPAGNRPAARRGRLVEQPGPEQASSALTHVVAGVLAAAQALVLSLAVVVLPAVVAYLVGNAALAAPSDAADDGTQVRSAIDVAAGLWLLGHGVPLTADDVTVTLAPLGIAALALFATYACAKRFAAASARAWAAGTVTYALGTTAVAALAGSAPGWSLVLAVPAGLVMGGLGMGLGILARSDSPSAAEIGEGAEELARRLTGADLVPATLRLGLRGGAVVVALLVGGAALLVAAWALAGRATSSDIVTSLEPGWTGGIVFAVAQLALLPNLLLWALAWLAGPGFAVGEGTSFTPFGTVSGPLPAVPLLGSLPGEDWANPVSAWAPVLVVACGVAAAVFAWRRLEPSLVRWADVGWVLGGIVLVPGVFVLLGQWAAAGAVGPGRLSEIGAQPLVTAGLVAAEVGGGAAAVLLGAKLDVVARRGEIGEDLVSWLRRPAPVGGEQDRDEEPGGEARDLAAELGFDGSPGQDHGAPRDAASGDDPDPRDAADEDPAPSRDWARTDAYAVSDPEPDVASATGPADGDETPEERQGK